MISTSGKFSALIIFDEAVSEAQQQDDNNSSVPLDNYGIILPRKAPFWAFCGVFAGRATSAPFPGR